MNTGNIQASANVAKETPATIANVITVGNSLADLLVDEANLLGSMQITKIGELQERKLKLTSLLERYTRYLSKNPESFSNMTEEEKVELQAANDHFSAAIKENYEKLLVARAVNQAIVTCVTGLFTNKGDNHLYNARGTMGSHYRMPISMTLNKVI